MKRQHHREIIREAQEKLLIGESLLFGLDLGLKGVVALGVVRIFLQVLQTWKKPQSRRFCLSFPLFRIPEDSYSWTIERGME